MSRRRRISQREALRLRKRVTELERADADRRNAYAREDPGGVHMGTIDLSQLLEYQGRFHAAQLLGAALVARSTGGSRLEIFALPKP
jgi:hypothetical protein